MRRYRKLLFLAIVLDVVAVITLAMPDGSLGVEARFMVASMGYYSFAPLYLAIMAVDFRPQEAD